jgi:sugar phosphate permease
MFSALSSMAAPTLQASIVKYISENQVGEVFGALSLIKNVLIMGAPSLFLFVYSHSVTQMPRLVFLMALVFIGASIVATLFLKVQPQHHQFGVKDAEEEEGSSRLVDYEIAGSPAQERQRQYSGGSGR